MVMAMQLSASIAAVPKKNMRRAPAARSASPRFGASAIGMRPVALGSGLQRAGLPARLSQGGRVASRVVAMAGVAVPAWNDAATASRLQHLEEQAMAGLKQAVESFPGQVTFPCALIAGDVVILDLLSRLGFLESGKVKVGFIDTFHLFDETIAFLGDVEKRYNFKAHMFKAVGCETKAEYDAKYGANLWKEDIEEYDRVCKVEPFSRLLSTLDTKCMINGRRRDHGFERAFLEVWEAGGMNKLQPLAYWEFKDCFDYLESRGVPAHPLHAQGYPSIGDAKDTVPVPKEKWFEYAGERSGRFQGLTNKDGTTKTECGIHVDGAEKTWDRDLWEAGKTKVVEVSDLKAALNDGQAKLLVVYAPWCKFCQAMEGEYAKVAESADFPVVKFRGDEQRDLIDSVLGAKTFPSVYAISGTGKATKYESEQRDAKSLTDFFRGKVAA